MTRIKRKLNKTRKAFTMIELMAVLVILGLLAGVVAVNVIGKINKAKVITTKTNLKLLKNAVISFHMDTGRFPTDDEGINALVEEPADVENWEFGGYLDTTEVPRDAWGEEFYYELYPESGQPFVIYSLGADKQEDGEDYDTDLLSTDAE